MRICEKCKNKFKPSKGFINFCSTQCKHSNIASKESYQRGIETRMRNSFGQKKEFKVHCEICPKIFKVIEREKRHPERKKYFCSRSCANTRKYSQETKEKISKTFKKKTKKKQFCFSCSIEVQKGKYCIKCKKFSHYKIFFKKLNIQDANLLVANKKALKILKKEYFKNKSSSFDIFKKYKISNIFYFFKLNGISLRNNSEATKNAISTGRLDPTNFRYVRKNKNYKTGYHITWDNQKVFLRSSYEFRYAKELDFKKIKYEVEKFKIKYFDTQKNKYRYALPDFFIVSENKIVEIKSDWTLDKQNIKDKEKAYRKQGYNFELKILD